MFNPKEFHKKWQQENKDKVIAYSKKYRQANKEKVREINKNWRKNNPEKAREIAKRGHKKFIETHNWTEYCDERRKARAERLRQQGVKNPWSVINGKEARYD